MTATAVIIGAGPAGLTAALEMLRHTGIRPIVLESSGSVGGISRTVRFDGNRMDIGGHRFFSKSDWVMNWWQDILPVDTSGATGEPVRIAYRNSSRHIHPQPTGAPVRGDRVMILRSRLSRIYFLRRFFDYPIKLNLATARKLGLVRCLKAVLSYARACVLPRRPERSLEDFLVNRFGGELYRTFFKSYTEKVWGVPCDQISAEWGAQRIRGLSLTRAIQHAFRQSASKSDGLVRPASELSLIEQFLYPRLGPGQLWEEVADRIREAGGEIRFGHRVHRIVTGAGRVVGVSARDAATGMDVDLPADYVISTMPVKELVASFDPPAPENVARIAGALPYRDFITVGLVVAKMTVPADAAKPGGPDMLPDNWVYVHEPDVKLSRLQVFNNWSPDMAANPGQVCLGLEYFCNEDDDLWQLPDDQMQALAISELERIGLIAAADVKSAKVVRVPKAYPAYFGAYGSFATVREHLDRIPNLFLVGRNGMHRYNNQDHSMLTAKAAVDNIAAGRTDKSNLWSINVDDDYHEAREPKAGPVLRPQPQQ